MRIRLLRNVRMAGANSVELLAGTVVNAMPDVADKWLKQGIACLDKSIEPKEHKITQEIDISVPKTEHKKVTRKRKVKK